MASGRSSPRRTSRERPWWGQRVEGVGARASLAAFCLLKGNKPQPQGQARLQAGGPELCRWAGSKPAGRQTYGSAVLPLSAGEACASHACVKSWDLETGDSGGLLTQGEAAPTRPTTRAMGMDVDAQAPACAPLLTLAQWPRPLLIPVIPETQF